MQSFPLALMAALVALLPWMQNSTMAGSSLSAHTVEQVMPAVPAGPSVVMTDTAVASFESALRNCAAVTQTGPASDAWSCGASCGMAAVPIQLRRRCAGPADRCPSLGPWGPVYY